MPKSDPTNSSSTPISSSTSSIVVIHRSSSDSKLINQHLPLPPPPSHAKDRKKEGVFDLRTRKKSDLTDENLEEFRRRSSYSKNSTSSSPYYKGLTDSSLYITRQRGVNGGAGTSPGGESNGTAVSSNSISSVFSKFSSCFKRNGDHNNEVIVAASSSLKTESTNSSYSSSITFSLPDVKNLGLSKKIKENEHLGIGKVKENGSVNGKSSSSSDEKPIGPRSLSSSDAKSLSSSDEKLIDAKNSSTSDEKPITAKSSSSSSSSSFDEKPLRESVSSVAPTVGASAPEPVPIGDGGVVVGQKRKVKRKEFVWADKYRPKALKDFICNRDKAEHLQDLLRKGHCGHFVFEGPPGVGKRTMIWALLREAFGLDNSVTREECKTFELKGEAKPSIQVNVKVSAHHVEINLSELCGYEKHVIVELIKETQYMDQTRKCDHTNCHAIIIHQADRLSGDAQHYIRWLMERDKGCNKIFFCSTEFSKLQHIRSICSVIQLLPPSNKEIVEVLEFIAEQEGIQLPHLLAERIADNSKHNLRQAIRSFEASWQLNYPFKEDQVILTGWEDDVAKIARKIIMEQSPRQLYIIRGKLQNLIDHNVSPDFIFSSLVRELKGHVCHEFHSKIDAFYLEYKMNSGGVFDGEKSLVLLHSRYEESKGKSNHDLRKNVQHFMRIEEFTAKFMSYYKAELKKKSEGTNGFGIPA